MSKNTKNLGQQIRVDSDASDAIDEVRQPLGNPDKRTLASAMIRWAIEGVKSKKLSFVNGALVSSDKIAA